MNMMLMLMLMSLMFTAEEAFSREDADGILFRFARKTLKSLRLNSSDLAAFTTAMTCAVVRGEVHYTSTSPLLVVSEEQQRRFPQHSRENYFVVLEHE
jgi:hypothetical protein